MSSGLDVFLLLQTAPEENKNHEEDEVPEMRPGESFLSETSSQGHLDPSSFFSDGCCFE